ncbi:MAG: NRDE family protein [Flavobacterium sp.]|nr:NRDE family protein [Flavobacterium sp.]
MCTVSFVTANNQFIITSNRDEKVVRPAIEPQKYLINNTNIIFPKDPKAGGTWYAVSENGTILVLLNGASEKHEVANHYRKSRGLIVLDLISSNLMVLEFWKTIVLDNIEPFTLVLFQDKKLYQLRWDGNYKEAINLDETKSYIWSSSTLYSKDIRENRASWFRVFLDTTSAITPTAMLNFHRYTEEDNFENGLVINRNQLMQTLSITQAVVDKEKVTLNYYDLQTQKDFINLFSII